ncbi:hypothetical protein AMTRI_Chr04g252400 [Amborella trichopoda]
MAALSQKQADIQMMLAADAHLGTKNCDFQMERYVFKRKTDGIYIINLVIVAIENPQDIIVQSARPYGQRAVLKFAHYVGAHPIAGRHTPGTFTNLLQTSYSEPRFLILTDPRTDHQVNPFCYCTKMDGCPLSYFFSSWKTTIYFFFEICVQKFGLSRRLPRIHQCVYVDIGIPANNKGKHSIGCLFWLLARMVLQMRGTILPGAKAGSHGKFRKHSFVDLFCYREPEEAKEQEEEELAGEQWPTAQISDAQWGVEVVTAPSVPTIPAESGALLLRRDIVIGGNLSPPFKMEGVVADGWDSAPAPPPIPVIGVDLRVGGTLSLRSFVK